MLRIVFLVSADRSAAKASSTKPHTTNASSDHLYTTFSWQFPGYGGAFPHYLSEKSIHLGLRSTACLHIPGVLTTISDSTHLSNIPIFLTLLGAFISSGPDSVLATFLKTGMRYGMAGVGLDILSAPFRWWPVALGWVFSIAYLYHSHLRISL